MGLQFHLESHNTVPQHFQLSKCHDVALSWSWEMILPRGRAPPAYSELGISLRRRTGLISKRLISNNCLFQTSFKGT